MNTLKRLLKMLGCPSLCAGIYGSDHKDLERNAMKNAREFFGEDATLYLVRDYTASTDATEHAPDRFYSYVTVFKIGDPKQVLGE